MTICFPCENLSAVCNLQNSQVLEQKPVHQKNPLVTFPDVGWLGFIYLFFFLNVGLPSFEAFQLPSGWTFLHLKILTIDALTRSSIGVCTTLSDISYVMQQGNKTSRKSWKVTQLHFWSCQGPEFFEGLIHPRATWQFKTKILLEGKIVPNEKKITFEKIKTFLPFCCWCQQNGLQVTYGNRNSKIHVKLLCNCAIKWKCNIRENCFIVHILKL